MSVNKFLPHVYVIPEDRADEQIANGFILHDQVNPKQVQILPCADGWSGVREKFKTEYIVHLRNYPKGYVILLIDFDSQYPVRRQLFDQDVPPDLKNRVFVVGPRDTPELLRQDLGKSLEQIGISLAEDCYRGTSLVWEHDQLKHNQPDCVQLIQSVKSILFGE